VNIGKIIGQANSKHIILRNAESTFDKKIPEIGENVYTAEKQRIGIIADIFGPVKKPFVSVKVFDTSTDIFQKYKLQKGSSLFTLAQKQKSSSDRANRRRFKAKTISPKFKTTTSKKTKAKQKNQNLQKLHTKNS